MRSSRAQRLLSNFLTSTASCGSEALPPASRSAAAQAALGQTCRFHARQSTSPSTQLGSQRSGSAIPPGNGASTDSRLLLWREQFGSLATLFWRQDQQQQQQQQWQQHGRCLHTSPAVRQDFVTLNNLQDNEGARRWVRDLTHRGRNAAAHVCHCLAAGQYKPYTRQMEAVSHAFTQLCVGVRRSE